MQCDVTSLSRDWKRMQPCLWEGVLGSAPGFERGFCGVGSEEERRSWEGGLGCPHLVDLER